MSGGAPANSRVSETVRMAQAAAAAAATPMDPVKLIASDGTEIILDRRAAMVSGTIKSMLSGPGTQELVAAVVAAVGWWRGRLRWS